ncbi:MAG: DUF3850 domain-containing protein [archaeon]
MIGRVIEKKIWPDMFDVDKELVLDFRLADFDLEPGDKIKFREWAPDKGEYTGREYIKTVKQVVRCNSPIRYWTPEQMEKHGMYLLEWKD